MLAIEAACTEACWEPIPKQQPNEELSTYYPRVICYIAIFSNGP